MKKSLPLSLLHVIEAALSRIEGKPLAFDKSSKFFKVYDTDEGSTFFFEVNDTESKSGNLAVTFTYSPTNRHTIANATRTEWVKDLLPSFEAWLSLIEAYDTVKTPFDDPILKKYEKEFFAEFEIVDKDADEVGFDYPKQLLIDNALSEVIQVLENNKDEKNSEKVEEIIAEAEEIKDTLTELTKKETASRISRLYAKIRKGGMKLIKDTYPIFQKEIIGQGIKKIIEIASNADLPSITDILT
jgi:hypothetical protein